jgi:hypothetical protein
MIGSYLYNYEPALSKVLYLSIGVAFSTDALDSVLLVFGSSMPTNVT